jgi:hypothetical protein
MGTSKNPVGQGPWQRPGQVGQTRGHGLTRKRRPRTSVSPYARQLGRSPVFAHMGMPKLKVKVNDQLASKALDAANSLWPNQGQRAVNRLARDAILRYLRYSGDGTQHRP